MRNIRRESRDLPPGRSKTSSEKGTGGRTGPHRPGANTYVAVTSAALQYLNESRHSSNRRNEMKLAIITDLHMDPANPGRLDLVDRFIARATEEDASVVIDLGDRLTDTSKAADLQQLQAISGAFARYHGPRIHLIGNHDIVNLDADEQARILGVPMTNRILEFEHVRLVVWQGSPSLTDQGFIASEEQVDWLEAQLRYDDDRPAIVLSHIPIAENSQIGKFLVPVRARFRMLRQFGAVEGHCASIRSGLTLASWAPALEHVLQYRQRSSRDHTVSERDFHDGRDVGRLCHFDDRGGRPTAGFWWRSV